MKEKLKNYLKKSTLVYGISKNIYHNIYYAWFKHIRPLLGTKLEEKYWKKQSLSMSEEFWDMRNHPHRNFLIEQISAFSPFYNILEMGCNSGPNLYLLAKKFPNTELKGIDINSCAVEYGNARFKQERIINVNLSVGKADTLEEFNDNSFDIVFTDAVLIYVGRDKIKKVIKELIRISRKALILMEWHSFGAESNPLGYYGGHWIRDYYSLLKMFITEEKIRIIKMPEELWPDKNWQKYGGVVVAEK